MPVRHEYRLDLAVANPRADLPVPAGVFVRAISPGDVFNLAELMLDAYRNTIDYEGEGIAEALAEVDAVMCKSGAARIVASAQDCGGKTVNGDSPTPAL